MADLLHLHLHVRDVAKSRRFYETWFGMKEHAQHGDILFLRDGRGFDLALAPDASAAPIPSWFHFGFRLERPKDASGLHARMAGAKVPRLGKLHEDPTLVHFRVHDPDGYPIDVYWE